MLRYINCSKDQNAPDSDVCTLLHRNNKVSLAEIDRMVTQDKFWQICNHKPALMRAYKYATSRAGGGDGDAYIERKEFKALLSNLFYFNKLFLVFDAVDSGSDRRFVVGSGEP